MWHPTPTPTLTSQMDLSRSDGKVVPFLVLPPLHIHLDITNWFGISVLSSSFIADSICLYVPVTT